MTNTTVYTHDLLLKMRMHYLTKTRKTAWILFFLTGGFSVYCIVADLLSEYAHTLPAGTFFLALTIIWISILMQGRKAKLSKAVRIEMSGNPDTVIEFEFEQDCFKTRQTSKYTNGSACHSYDVFAKAVKMDENSCYLLTKQNQFYVLYDENGISELYDFVCAKIKQ